MKNGLNLILKKTFVIVFIFNFILFLALAGVVYSEYISNDKQSPLKGIVPKDSPQDYVDQDQIIVTKDYVLINIKDADWSQYADTHSMEPVISSKANGIEIIPKCENIKPGDIIVYEANWANKGLVVHRVMAIQEDELGLSFTLKGDNNPSVDPEKVRCSQIRYQVIGIIY